MKAAALIMLALTMDGLQAVLSASLAVVAAFPGTIAGGVAGCLAGNYLLGEWGCTILGIAGSLFGTLLDGAAVVTEPVGIIIGFVVSICISATFGPFLLWFLFANRMFYPKYIFPGSIVELLPGFEILPSWTAMTVACVLQKMKDEKVARAREIVAGGLDNIMQADTTPINYLAQRGGREVLTPYGARRVDGIKAPGGQTNAA